MKHRSSPARARRAIGVTALLALVAALAPAAAAALPDGRGWELVSPVEKNGGGVAGPGDVFGGGVFQAAPDGNSVTYSSTSSFSPSAQSAPPGSQYLSARDAGGWTTTGLDVPIFSGSYGPEPDGVPYRLFSADLSRGLLLSGFHCRSAPGYCPVANPPLPGTDAPAGYMNYYLRQSGSGFEALLGSGDIAATALDPDHFDLRLVGATPDLAHAVLQSCAALAPGAVEVPLGEICDPAKQNLYAWSGGALTAVNAAPGAELAAPAGAISASGARVYFVDRSAPAEPKLLLREGAQLKTVAEAAVFQAASADGAVAFFTKAGDLWRYDAAPGAATPLTSSGNVLGVLGSSADGSYLYYVQADGLYVWHGGATKIPTNGGTVPTDAANFPPATGTARVSADGTKLVLLSTASLTGYNNANSKTGQPEPEVFRYDVADGQLRCVSCRPTGIRPSGPSTISGAYPNGDGLYSFAAYKPRVLSADGKRVFFDSEDGLISADTNQEPDVYQWQAIGPGCNKLNGCIDLISSGRSEGGARFIDASSSGADVFFITDGALVGADRGSIDLYDARIGGGFPEPLAPIPCLGDSCQDLPSEPVDPGLNTLVAGPGNPKVRYYKYRRKDRACRTSAKQAKCKKAKKGKKRSSTDKGGRR